MQTICGIDCTGCAWNASCKGCVKTGGRPFGGSCVAAECWKSGGESCFRACKEQLIREFNALEIADMPPVTELCSLYGAYINSTYTLPNGQKVTLLEDEKIYLGYQLEKKNSNRCYGLAADETMLLVCEYGYNGADPEIVVYRRREGRK